MTSSREPQEVGNDGKKQQPVPSSLVMALRSEDGSLEALAEALVIKLGASVNSPAEDFAYLTARTVAEAVRSLTVTTEAKLQEPAPPMAKAKLFKQCQGLAQRLGGQVGSRLR